ncbi:unnamed protein product [Symbiodinium natans]|uniref:Nitroreductase domain-containing protein n=1 Tax=Symbiodinium natans TaxID=878477 RepID=A0A812IDL7_9DINO|nr:unnamed protein product [Symbiodinium natans]
MAPLENRMGFLAGALVGFAASTYYWLRTRRRQHSEGLGSFEVLPCLRARRSVMAHDFVAGRVDAAVVTCLLEAAMWAPYHGPRAPWRFVVLGRGAMVEMQKLTLEFYDRNWQSTGWGAGTRGSEAEYQKWRSQTEEAITGRWGPVSFMIAIVMQRQAHPEKRMPEWEEAAATACAVQNMHIQASSFPGLACYWSSWHASARDSLEMRNFLGMQAEDRCLGFFMVASCRRDLPDRRRRKLEDCAIEWRL